MDGVSYSGLSNMFGDNGGNLDALWPGQSIWSGQLHSERETTITRLPGNAIQTNVSIYPGTVPLNSEKPTPAHRLPYLNGIEYGDPRLRQECQKRTRSCELPLGANSASQHSLSKSWEPSKIENVKWNERVTELFRLEEAAQTKRATEFQENTVLRKLFAAWLHATMFNRLAADGLCRRHLLQKGWKALKCAADMQNQILSEFQYQRNRMVLNKHWTLWRDVARTKKEIRLRNMFNQWHYYKLHLEREKLLNTMVKRHVLAKKYSMWKERFSAKQKNSIASLHFKIGLLHECWRRWALYVRERRVKNDLNCIARSSYAQRRQQYYLKDWREKTRKSQLCRTISRRSVLIKAFIQWKHWTQYAKIVRLRSHNMCKQYHRKKLLWRTLQHWKRSLDTQRSVKMANTNQLRRSLKLWKLRLMRKKLHKHLCRALAKKAKKRRCFKKWCHFLALKKEKLHDFVMAIEKIQIRVILNRWQDFTATQVTMRKSLTLFQSRLTSTVIKNAWNAWRFHTEVANMRKRHHLSWSKRCVRKSYQVWTLKMRKKNLILRMTQNQHILQTLALKRFFAVWRRELGKSIHLNARAEQGASLIQRNCLSRAFLAWRVVNQEDCIIHELVQKRERKAMASVFDAWRYYVTRKKTFREYLETKVINAKRKMFEHWRLSLRMCLKEQELRLVLCSSKLRRHFLSWSGYTRDCRMVEEMRSRRKERLTRKFAYKWKRYAEENVENREQIMADKARQQILLVSFFTVWRERTNEQVLRSTHMEQLAKIASEERRTTAAFARWHRQYTVERKTNEYLEVKREETLRDFFSRWRLFINDEMEQQVNEFAAHLLLESSMTTSGYQTSLKASSTPLHFLSREIETFQPIGSPRSRPLTPTRSSDESSENLSSRKLATLPSYRPITNDRQPHMPGYQSPPGFHAMPHYSSEQLSQPASWHQQSSEDDNVPSSGVHSAADETDQDENSTSLNIAESVCSLPTTDVETPRDRELLVADTILHWRSLSTSVAFRSWYKYTKHRVTLRGIYSEFLSCDREKRLRMILHQWRRWLRITVLARQHRYLSMIRAYFISWVAYRENEIVLARNKDEAVFFRRSHLTKYFFGKWKSKKTSKKQILSILGKWQKNATVTSTDKVVISQFKERDQAVCLRKSFSYWKNHAAKQREALAFCKNSIQRRYLHAWSDVASYQAELGIKVTKFRSSCLLSKAFKEWCIRYKDNRTAKILIGVTDERLVRKIFKAWHAWSETTSLQRKASFIFHDVQEKNRLKERFHLWRDASKIQAITRTHHGRMLQRRVLQSWRNILVVKANYTTATKDIREIVERNQLRRWFASWRQRTVETQLLSQYLKQRSELRLRRAFVTWRQGKRRRVADEYFAKILKKRAFQTWCRGFSKRKKARQQIKKWHIKAEGTKEREHLANNAVHVSEMKLLKSSFIFWKKYTGHLQLAEYHHSKKINRRIFKVWREYSSRRRLLHLKLQQFQSSHEKNSHGLLAKYIKIWKIKATCSTKAEKIYHGKVRDKYWQLWRHNFVRHKVSFAMVEHDNRKVLARVFTSWHDVTSSHKRLKREVELFRAKHLFRKWMSRYNNS